MPLAMLDLTTIIVAVVAAVPATIGAVGTLGLHRKVKVPSGGTLGAVVDSTNGLAGITVAHTTELVKAEHKRESNGQGRTV